jgi:RNA polymerase-binding transcription factor DksA
MLTQDNLQVLKGKLEATQTDLESEIKKLEETPDFGSDVDSGEEESDETEEIGTNIGTADSLNNRLMNVRSALRKMEAGSYGKCEACARDISLELLEVDPESQLCKECKQKEKE